METDRLRLRQFRPDDLDDVARLFANPDVMRFMGVAGETHSTAEAEKALLSIIAHWQRHGFGRWAVIHQAHEKLIGYGGLRSFGHNAELVYLLDQPYWGQGLATELATACLKFGFESRRFDEIVALIKPGNAASRRVLEKIGLRYQGRVEFFKLMAKAGMPYLKNDGTATMEVLQYSILRAEFKSG